MSDPLAFLSGGGEAERLIRTKDWSSHPMGPPAGWPATFKSLLSLLLNSPESLILAWGPELSFFFNEAYFPLLGPRLSWAMGERFDKVWADGWDQAKPIIDEAMAGRSRRFVDLPWKLGTDRGAAETWWTFSYSRVLDSDGEIAGLLIVTNETTARVVSEQKRKFAEEQLLSAQQAGGVGLFSVDLNDNQVWPTPEFCRLFGLPVQERYTAAVVEGLIFAEDAHLVSTASSRAQGAPIHDVEYRIRRQDSGEVRWINRKAKIERDEAGAPVRFSGIARDVTAEREAVERLRASEAVARQNIERVQLALAAGAIIGTWFWDIATDRFTVDEAFANAFGLDPALGREGIPLADIVATVHPDDQAGLAEAIQSAIGRGGSYAHQYRTRRADGRYYWLEANGQVNLAPDGTALTFPGVLIDVEERRAVEAERDRVTAQLRTLTDTLEQRVAERSAELLRSEELLRQSQKMEAVGQLTGGLAHDFNNLLAGISGSLELIALRIGQGRLKDLDKYMAAAQGATKRAAALTHRLLAFSRRQTLEPKATDVHALVSGLLDMIQRTVGPAIPIDVVETADLWTALVDPSQLENALLNLCINARDAMPDGGRITIETSNRGIDHVASQRQDMPEGQYLALCVTDTGTGMPPEVIAKAFEPFFTTKPLGEGTGLGLSMIYGFAKQSGGQVRIHSVVGEGTTVCIYLPRHIGEVGGQGTELSPGIVPQAETGETVLVVDDEPTVRLLVTDVLEDLGYTVVEAADSAGGLRVLQSDVRVDLLVTDVGLPGGMNGRQMADAGRARRPGLKVLFITGYAENALLKNGQLDGGMSVLTKPFAVDALATRIRELIAR